MTLTSPASGAKRAEEPGGVGQRGVRRAARVHDRAGRQRADAAEVGHEGLGGRRGAAPGLAAGGAAITCPSPLNVLNGAY
jgi:hypothetical protein